MKTKLKKLLRAGFTLLELLLVLVIIATLAGLAMPAYSGSVEKMRNAEAIEHLMATRSSLQRHYLQYGSFSSATIPLFSPGNLDFNPNVDMTGNIQHFNYRFSSGPAADSYTLEAWRVINWVGCSSHTAHVFMQEDGTVTTTLT